MSHATQPEISAPRHGRPARTVTAAASLLALGAVALTFAFGAARHDDPSPVSAPAQSSLRTDGGPEEGNVAASVGVRPASAPDESGIAASISGR
jgi:hypothetical protein